MNEDMTTIAKRVQHARIKKKLSCAEVDEIAGLTCGHTATIERGARENPSALTVAKLARALDVDMAWLVSGGKLRVA